jgi:nucleoside-diphosphate-sugar epimerase
MKRVLVTGATGFIGRQALLPLLERGYEVHAFYNSAPIESDSRVIWYKADLLERGVVEKLCNELRPTHLLHFAWYVSAQDYKTSPENEHWKKTTLNLMRAFKANGGVRAVFAGTCMEYDWNTTEPMKEDWPTSNETPYGTAKNETHFACERFAKESGISFAWARIFNLYGPHEAERRLVPRVIQAFLAGDTFEASAAAILDYSYVVDIAEAFVTLLESRVVGSINVASGKPVTPTEIAQTIADIMQKKSSTEFKIVQNSSASPEHVVADVTKLRQELGWSPRFSLHEGLELTVDWWKSGKRP